MRGLFLRRAFPEPGPKTVTITVTGTGHKTYCYLTMPDSTKVYSAGTYEVESGSTIVCYAQAIGSYGSVVLNGTEVAGGSNTATYNYTVTKSATIHLSSWSFAADMVITITEG